MSDIRIFYKCMADIQAEPLEWLWPLQIARGKITLVAGEPGLGKSQIMSSLAAIVTTGSTWPTSAESPQIGNVVILSAEDDVADTIKPRLEAAGADPAKVYLVDTVIDYGGNKAQRFVDLGHDLNKLAEMIENIGYVSLVIIDPISAYLGDLDAYKNAEVQSLLLRVSEVAKRLNVAIVCISHVSESKDSHELHHATGSLSFVSTVRTAYLVSRDKDIAERRLLLPLKNNIGNDSTGFAFRIVSHTLRSGIKTSRIEWGRTPILKETAKIKESTHNG